MIAKSNQMNLHISPKKLRFLIEEVKKMKPIEALDYLYYSPKKSAQYLYKAIFSAISNAKNALKAQDDLLEFKLLSIDEGFKLKRFRAGGRGTAKMFRRKFAHIHVELEVQKKVLPVGTPKKKEVKKKLKK